MKSYLAIVGSGLFWILFCVSCGGAGDYQRRIVMYSTSPGFESVRSESEGPPASPQAPEPSTSPAEGTGDAGPVPSDEPATNPEIDPGPVETPLPEGADAFADRVVSYELGPGGGFHEDEMPEVVLNAPRGGGLFQGSFHVLSLGLGGEIVLEMTDFIVFDGDGPDFTVFENAFQVSGASETTFAEPGIVGASEDGVTFVDFPCDLSGWPFEGCAGVTPVLANEDSNDLDPTDPAVSGGDSFDLADIGFETARFVRIRDAGMGLGPIGPGTRGFDLDAVAVIHGTLP